MAIFNSYVKLPEGTLPGLTSVSSWVTRQHPSTLSPQTPAEVSTTLTRKVQHIVFS